MNEKVRNRWRGVYEFYEFYLLRHANGQTQVSFIASSVKIITKRVAVMYQIQVSQESQDGLMLRLICVFLGCDMPIQLVLSSEYDDWKKIVSSCTDLRHRLAMKYVTFYGVTIDTDQFVAIH